MRQMIHTAFIKAGIKAGGVSYLVKQSRLNPKAFMGLVGKIVPTQIDATIRRELPEMSRDELLALLQVEPKRPVTIDADRSAATPDIVPALAKPR
ncbi:MAG: hypothetical protein JO208_14440, partial [Alphaproteobacteria bacterium]|nr:hypothetical protein [Alphaproteobacteria bacterium]